MCVCVCVCVCVSLQYVEDPAGFPGLSAVTLLEQTMCGLSHLHSLNIGLTQSFVHTHSLIHTHARTHTHTHTHTRTHTHSYIHTHALVFSYLYSLTHSYTHTHILYFHPPPPPLSSVHRDLKPRNILISGSRAAGPGQGPHLRLWSVQEDARRSV